MVLASFFADLALLDYHLLRYYPATIAAAVLFVTSMTLQHLSEQRLTVTSLGIVTSRSREVLGLVRTARWSRSCNLCSRRLVGAFCLDI